MFRRLVLAALALATAGIAATAQAQQKAGDRWVRLSTSDVNLARGFHPIDLRTSTGSFKAVRLELKRGDMLISNVEVKYSNNTAHQEQRRINLLEGERTRWIDPGTERFLDQVNVTYQSAPGARVATLEVWGLQSIAGAKARRPVPASGNISAGPTASIPTTAKPGEQVAGGEVLFGAQSVGFGVDRDVIRIGYEIGQFERMRLRVLDHDIFINDMTVVYMNGERETLAVGAEVKANTRSRHFKLKGDQFIREIELRYRSRPNLKGQARIEVYGEYAQDWLGPQGRGRQYNQGWVLLGAQTAGFVGFDNDLIQVGQNEGGFKRIRVNVRDRAITLNELRVIYLSNESDIIPIKTRVDAGSSYGPVDIKGGTRAIREIRAKYRSRFLDTKAIGKGAAVVEVWGQH